MSIYKQDNKIISNLAGEILKDNSSGESSEILHIDTDLQIQNRILKDDTNKVKQITDKANGIAFYGIDSNLPTFVHGEGYRCNDQYLNSDTNLEQSIHDLADNEFIICFDILVNAPIPDGNNHTIVALSVGTGVGGVYQPFGWSVRVHETRVTFYYSADGITVTTLSMYTNSITFTSGGKYSIAIVNMSSYMYLVVNDIVEKVVVRTNTIFFDPGMRYQFNTPYNHSSSDITVDNLKVYKGSLSVPTPVIGNDGHVSKYTQPFNYYHRYKDGEAYISSTYLKDAVISDTNKIERVYNSISDTYFEELTNNPTLTKNGFLYDTGEILTQAISNEYNYGLSDFFIGQWVDFKSESDVFNIGGLIKIGIDSTNIYAETIGGKLYATISNVINEGHKYIGFHREGGNIFLTVGGIFESSRVESIDYNTDVTAIIGGLFIGLHDDLLNVKNSIITFVGKSQSNKVFEPPMRGGFDSEIKQY